LERPAIGFAYSHAGEDNQKIIQAKAFEEEIRDNESKLSRPADFDGVGNAEKGYSMDTVIVQGIAKSEF
jgi:hypothetical protein